MFLGTLNEVLGTQLTFSIVFHPQEYGQSERMIHVLGDMLRLCVTDFEGFGDPLLPLYENPYNNNYHSNKNITPIGTLRRICR